jgi:hypothetical protein
MITGMPSAHIRIAACELSVPCSRTNPRGRARASCSTCAGDKSAAQTTEHSDAFVAAADTPSRWRPTHSHTSRTSAARWRMRGSASASNRDDNVAAACASASRAATPVRVMRVSTSETSSGSSISARCARRIPQAARWASGRAASRSRSSSSALLRAALNCSSGSPVSSAPGGGPCVGLKISAGPRATPGDSATPSSVIMAAR